MIFKFYRTSEPPTNIPLRLSLPDDVFSHAVKEWLLGFTHFHRHQFPPLHKPRAPFVHIKGRTWGQSLFNFRHWLRWWYADQKIECKCDQFPAHIQRKSRELPHIVAWATDCFPHVPQFKLHMASEQPPRWQHLFLKQPSNLNNGLNVGAFLGIYSSVGSIFYDNNGILSVNEKHGHSQWVNFNVYCRLLLSPLQIIFHTAFW